MTLHPQAVNDRLRRVLVADDNPHVRAQLVCALTASGFSCTEAEDGAAAFDRFLKGGFDLVVTDLNMPGLDGAQLMSAIALSPGGARAPVILISADVDERLLGRRPDLRRASAILAKPVVVRDLLAAVSAALAPGRGRRCAQG